MKQQFVSQALEKFAKEVIKQSRSNLTRKDKNVNNNLYNSLAYKLSVGKGSFSLSFEMEKYGDFQDKGVSGKEVKYDTDYSFKNKMPPVKPLAEWAKARGIRLRDDKGRYLKGNYQTIGFLIARSLFKKGIKPSLFFTKPFENRFKQLPDEVVNDYALEIDNFLSFTRK